MSASRKDIVQAYRQLYRQGLRAVQYSGPARYTLRDRLRYVFRASNSADFDQKRIDNTLEFLKGATLYTGLEHKIVKNLLHVWYMEREHWRKRGKAKDDELLPKLHAYEGFYHTLRMLNESMGMCIR